MTDPFDSLRPPRRPHLSGGDDRVITRGRRLVHRRRAAYGGVVGAGLVAVGAVAALDQGGSGRDSIRYLDPEPGSTPGASGSPSAASPTPTATPDPVSTYIDRLPPPIGASGAPAATPTAEPTPPSRGPYVGPEPTAPDGAAIVTRTTSTDRAFCAYGAQQQIGYSGWCSAVSGPQTVTAGTSSMYTLKMCRRPDAGAMTLHFDNRREFSMYVVSTDAAERQLFVWDAWRAADPVADAHELTVAAGDCVSWSTTWGGQDDDGYAVPQQNSYELYALPAANEFISDDADEAALPATIFLDVRWQ